MRKLTVILFTTLALSACDSEPIAPVTESEASFARLAEDTVAHGARLSALLGCSGCHGEDLTGNDWSDPAYGSMWTANLTISAAKYDNDHLKAIITSGKLPGGRALWDMPSHLFTQLSDLDMTALLAYIRSVPKKGEQHPGPILSGPLGQKLIAEGSYVSSATNVQRQGKLWPPDMGRDHARAVYMIRATCVECHDMNLRGGEASADGQRRPDLRIAASYTLTDFKRLLRNGIAAGDRKLGLMTEVALGRYSNYSDAEIAGIHAYLTALATRDP